ncbi:unnamed protein product [Polarella glacialis]|uniref:Uncharacterized protein n=1 Tax=Polarella glacialis TaxID=89957 RepID=A0A813JKY2_POLGL|nr:unnamed protein product [Polarella glacialis]
MTTSQIQTLCSLQGPGSELLADFSIGGSLLFNVDKSIHVHCRGPVQGTSGARMLTTDKYVRKVQDYDRLISMTRVGDFYDEASEDDFDETLSPEMRLKALMAYDAEASKDDLDDTLSPEMLQALLTSFDGLMPRS